MKKINLSKKFMTLLLAIFILATNTLVPNALSKNEAAWPQFRGDSLNPGVTDSKTPITSGEIEEEWAIKIGAGWSFSDPIIVGEYVYVTDSKNIKKYDKETGNLLLQKPLLASIGFFSRMAYGEGKLFIPVGQGRIQALDAETLESLWITEENPSDMKLQALSPVTYYNGYVYMGATNGSATNGLFYAVSAEDEDKTIGNEIKEYTWSYTPEVGAKGYYWSGAAIVNNSIVFGGENGQIVSHSLTSENIIDTLEINEAIRSSIHYDRKIGRVYITTKAGNIHSVKVNSDGTFDKASLLTKKIGSSITSSPVTYNGRVYVGGGGITSGAGFSVLDANTLEIIYQINGVSSQSSPILTTAYATAENNYTVYMYLFNYSNPDEIYVIKDFQGNTEASFEKVIKPSKPQYNSSSAAIDEDGSIYFKNDSGHLFKFTNKVNGLFTVNDVIDVINRLPNTEDITLNDELTINNVMDRYNALSEEDKAKVSNVEMLNKVIEKINNLKNADKEVERLLFEIDKLPSEVTLENKSIVNELFDSYSRLSEEHKAKVTNADKLINLKNAIKELENTETIKAMEDKINKLPVIEDIILDVEEDVNNLYKEFINLPIDIQNSIANKNLLIEAKEKIDVTREDVTSIEEDIWNKINPENITLEDKNIIDELILRYNSLDERDRKYVKYFDEVVKAKETIDKLKVENNSDDKSNTVTEDNTDKNKDINTESSTKVSLPQTGGINSNILILIAILILGSGAILFRNNKIKNN